MRKVLQIDSNGFYVGDIILQDKGATPDVIPSNCTDIICPDGFYKPQLQNGIWIEGMAQTDIDSIKNAVIPPTDTEVMQGKIDTLTSSLTQTGDVLNYIIENY